MSVCIAIPTGTKLFNWSVSYAMQNTPFSPSLLVTIAFCAIFTGGGLTGVILGNAGIDVALHDTFYVVAHFHMILSIGAVLGSILTSATLADAFSIEAPSVTDNVVAATWTLATFALFLPLHYLGVSSLARRVPDSGIEAGTLAFISTLGFCSAAVVLTLQIKQ